MVLRFQFVPSKIISTGLVVTSPGASVVTPCHLATGAAVEESTSSVRLVPEFGTLAM
jgi:hypothetical protein